MVKTYFQCVLAVIVMGMLSGCPKLVLKEEQEPNWVTTGSGGPKIEQGQYFQAVGKARGVQNRMLLRATADNTARDALLHLLQDYSERLIHRAGQGALSADEIKEHAGMLARLNLRQALISDHWQEPAAGGSLFARCRLDLSTYKEILLRYKALDEGLRRTMLENADEVYQDMMTKP